MSWAFTMIYNLWQARNDAREKKMLVDPKTVAMRTVAAVEECRNIQTPQNVATAKPKERWLPPDPRWRKVNADGAFRAAEGVGGDGVVIRDHHGDFVSRRR